MSGRHMTLKLLYRVLCTQNSQIHRLRERIDHLIEQIGQLQSNQVDATSRATGGAATFFEKNQASARLDFDAFNDPELSLIVEQA